MKWLPWIIFTLFAFFLVGNNFQAKLGIIDDHEIAMFLGQDGRVKAAEFIPVLLSTEVGQWGEYLRFRPSYYTLRLIETALWRDNANLWYLSRFVMLITAMWLGFKIMTTYFPRVVSYLFIFYLMTMPFWSDILTRLGPSEMYAVFALPLFIYGLINNRMWMITIGYLVCVGSKENFLILFPVLLFWLGYKLYNKNISKTELWTGIAMIAYTFWIIAAIVVATLTYGTDVYGTAISYRYRITKFIWDIPVIIKTRHLIPALIVMGISMVSKVKPWKEMALMACLLAIIASQYIFYINQLPSNMRYDYPALILFPIIDLVAIKMLMKLLAKSRLSQIFDMGLYLILIVISIFYIYRRGYALVQNQSRKVVETSSIFEQQMILASEKAASNPNAMIYFMSERSIDFEPIVSVARYLNAKSMTNKFMLGYTAEKHDAPNELNDRLINVHNGVMGKDGIFDRFSGYVPQSESCYSIIFNHAKPKIECPVIANF